MIDQCAGLVPDVLRNVSGSVFCSGRAAFSGTPLIYVLGANPGGDPTRQRNETVQAHSDFVLKAAPDLWSAYCDEAWTGRPAGQAPLQRRILYLFSRLGLNPRLVPASNLVFSRSRRLAHLDGKFRELTDICWPFHEAVIRSLRPAGIICFGVETGREVARRVGATTFIAKFQEQNQRRWRNLCWMSPFGQCIFGLTHPSIADWTHPNADPSPMVIAALGAGK